MSGPFPRNYVFLSVVNCIWDRQIFKHGGGCFISYYFNILFLQLLAVPVSSLVLRWQHCLCQPRQHHSWQCDWCGDCGGVQTTVSRQWWVSVPHLLWSEQFTLSQQLFSTQVFINFSHISMVICSMIQYLQCWGHARRLMTVKVVSRRRETATQHVEPMLLESLIRIFFRSTMMYTLNWSAKNTVK